MIDENRYKGFWQDFTIADAFGEAAIRDTYKRAFAGWKDNVEYFASLVMTLNHKIWIHHEAGNEALATIYNELWMKADDYGGSHFKGDDATYYFQFLDQSQSRSEMKCCLCGEEISGYGNNPWPLGKTEGALCCDDCQVAVIEARLREMEKERKQVVDKLNEAKQALCSALDTLERIDLPDGDWIRTRLDSHYNDIDDTLDDIV